MMKHLFEKAPTARAACSGLAGDWLFGNSNYVVIRNSIDVERFRFSGEDRSNVRGSYSIDASARVIGLVGSGIPVKNASYLIDLLPMLVERLNAHLLLIGEGSDLSTLYQYVREQCLDDRIHFTGTVKDPWRYYSAMDVLAMPSLYEGLPITLIEAQANGLPCVVSDVVTTEADVTGRIIYIPLEERELWVNGLIACASQGNSRTTEDPSLAVERVRDAGFSEDGLRAQLLELYKTR